MPPVGLRTLSLLLGTVHVYRLLGTFLMVKLESGSLARGLTWVLHETQMFGVQGVVVALAFDLSTRRLADLNVTHNNNE